MRVEFNRTGAERKELVKAIERITEEKARYLGAPSMAYQIGGFLVTRDGSIESDDAAGLEGLVESLAFEGILSEQEADSTELAVNMPREKYTDEALANLRKIVDSKARLFRKAFDADELPIQVSEDKVTFPWFTLQEPEDAKAFCDFITKVSEMANEAKRVTAKEKEVDNEKYAFRCFLLRLGFIGPQYKAERKVLLRNLTGSSAFKNGKKGGDE